MKYLLFFLTFFLAQSALAQLSIAQSPEQINDLIRQWNGTPELLRREWIKKLGPETLRLLKSSDDASLAVQAAWKLTTDALHQHRGKQPSYTDPRRLSYFLGFLEGRANIEAPVWWTKTMLTCRATANSAPIVNTAEIATSTIFEPIEMLRSVKDIHVTKNGQDYAFEYDGKKFTLPPEMLPMNDTGLHQDIDCIVDGKLIYVSAGRSDKSNQHTVCCIDTEKSTMTWRSKTSPSLSGYTSGFTNGYHEMRMFSSNRLFLFNASRIGYFVHGFDATNGNTIFQFSSVFSH